MNYKNFIIIIFVLFFIEINNETCAFYSNEVDEKKICMESTLPLNHTSCCFVRAKELLNNNGKTTKNMIQFCFPIQNSETRIKSMIQMFKKGIYGKNPMVDVEIECDSNYLYYSFLIFFIIFIYI